MTPIRIRIQTLPPNLPALRVWLVPTPVPSASSSTSLSTHPPTSQIAAAYTEDAATPPTTILDLKNSICAQIPALKDGSVRAGDVALFLDEFELLDGTVFGGVVRDGDLVCVKRSGGGRRYGVGAEAGGYDDDGRADGYGTKRKRVVSEVGVKAKKGSKSKVKEYAKRSKGESGEEDEDSSSSSSSSSSSPSSSSASSSSSTSTSSSDSDSDSDSSSSTSDDETPVPQKILKSANKTVPPPSTLIKPKTKSQPSVLHVPPGLGKPSTHSRNERRKRKKRAEQAAQTSLAVPGSSEANSVPLGSKSKDVDGMDVDEPKAKAGEENQYMMASLRNKNKKKGFFKESMMRGLSDGSKAKIVFEEENEGDDEEEAEVEESPTKTLGNLPRLVTPTELAEKGLLPKNVFVTSVDVEEGMWESSKRNKKNKKRKKEAVAEYEDPDQYLDAEEEVIHLVYDDEEESSSQLDWNRVEVGWNNYATVVKKEQLEAGKLVGWKGLSLNVATLTPEVMLSIARVVATGGDTVTVRHLERPAGEAAAAFGIVASADEEGEEEVIPWDAIQALGEDDAWRLVNL